MLCSYPFFLFAFLPSLTASASLPHSNVSFLVFFLTVSGFFHYPNIPWILFSSSSVHSLLLPPALPHSFLFVPLPFGTLYIRFICSLMYSFHHFLSFPYDPVRLRISVLMLPCGSCLMAGFAASIDYNWEKSDWNRNRNGE